MDRPLWSTRDLTVLEAFASPLPYQDVALVMAYPLEYASGDYDFVITKRAIKPDGLEIASVRRARLAPQP